MTCAQQVEELEQELQGKLATGANAPGVFSLQTPFLAVLVARCSSHIWISPTRILSRNWKQQKARMKRTVTVGKGQILTCESGHMPV